MLNRDEWVDLQKQVIAYVFFIGREKAYLYAASRLTKVHFSGDGQILWQVFAKYFEQTQGLPDINSLRDFFRSRKAGEEKLLACEQLFIDAEPLVQGRDHSGFIWMVGRLEDMYRRVKFEDYTEDSLVTLEQEGYFKARDRLLGNLSSLENTYADYAPDGFLEAELPAFIEEVGRARDQKASTSVDFGFPSIDSAMLGLRGGDMCLITGWTGVGKTTLCLNVAVNAFAVQKKNVVIVTTETIRPQVVRRAYSRMTRLPIFKGLMPVSSQKLKAGGLNSAEQDTMESLKNFLVSGDHGKLMVTQAPANATMEWLRGKLLQYESQFRIDLLILDDIRNMVPRVSRRQEFEEVSQLIRDFKRIARTHAGRGIPVISPYHINRETFKNFKQREGSQTNKGLSLAGLASSAEAERQTDVALLLWQNEDSTSFIEVIVLKMRDGKSGQSIFLTADLDFQYLEESRGTGRDFITEDIEE